MALNQQSGGPSVPDYELDDVWRVSSTEQLRAIFHPLRETLLDLLLERAATVGELAAAVERPKSTIAYHVGVLQSAGVIKVVRTRKVRAITERFYGRCARIFYVGTIEPDQLALIPNYLITAAGESAPAHQADRLRAILRYNRISDQRAEEFWRKVFALVNEFSEQPREGDQSYAFVAGLYPTDHPELPESDDAS